MGRSLSIEPSKGLQSNSTSIPLLYICAVALYKLDRMREALDRFDSVAAINERGSVLAAMKDYGAALNCFDRVLKFQPGYSEGHLNKANVLGALKCYDEAIVAYDKALAIKCDFPAAWAGRGNVLVELKKYDDAMAAYDKAIGLEPDLIAAWLGRANLLSALARYDDALATYMTRS